jgi:hypothetical protein
MKALQRKDAETQRHKGENPTNFSFAPPRLRAFALKNANFFPRRDAESQSQKEKTFLCFSFAPLRLRVFALKYKRVFVLQWLLKSVSFFMSLQSIQKTKESVPSWT